ncbi:MAG: 7-cyano-7-deazaguanine synthase QueC [Candidatus Kapabacteria bacterium]|nr:7-cyano-7-deazaguanine synthase QueC [Candidatus Kapabacteria bacterium]
MNQINFKSAVVLVSGGMDSAVCLAIAKDMGISQINALHLNYAQRTEKKELESFNKLLDFYHIKSKLIVDVSYFAQIGGSSLTDKNIEVPVNQKPGETIPSSYVPFRNANILGIAVAWAETIGADSIFIGANQLDSSGYPDCRQEFYDAYQNVINLGTKPETNIRIVTPLINMSKKDIVLKGHQLGVPFELTWSCYKNSDKACGVCDSCQLRLKGFSEANLIDPIIYNR